MVPKTPTFTSEQQQTKGDWCLWSKWLIIINHLLLFFSQAVKKRRRESMDCCGCCCSSFFIPGRWHYCSGCIFWLLLVFCFFFSHWASEGLSSSPLSNNLNPSPSKLKENFLRYREENVAFVSYFWWVQFHFLRLRLKPSALDVLWVVFLLSQNFYLELGAIKSFISRRSSNIYSHNSWCRREAVNDVQNKKKKLAKKAPFLRI